MSTPEANQPLDANGEPERIVPLDELYPGHWYTTHSSVSVLSMNRPHLFPEAPD